MAGTVNVYGRLHSVAVDTPLAYANEIKDTTQNKDQATINAELYAATANQLNTITEEEFNEIFT